MALSVSQNNGKNQNKVSGPQEHQDLNVNAATVVNRVTGKQNAAND